MMNAISQMMAMIATQMPIARSSGAATHHHERVAKTPRPSSFRIARPSETKNPR